WSASQALSSGLAADSSDADGSGSDPEYDATIRFADLDGDGRADVCGRAPSGILCARSLGAIDSKGESPGVLRRPMSHARVHLTEMADARGWMAPEYATTIALGDVDGDGRADVCGRSRAGIVCALSKAGGFGKPRVWSSGADFSDADVYSWAKDVGYYGTI